MDPITITHEQVMTTLLTAWKIVPVITGTYILFKIRKLLKSNAREIATCVVVIATLSSLAITTFNWVAGSNLKFDSTEKEQIALKEKLPGKWWNLYQTMENCDYYTSKQTAINAFANHYSPNDIQPLSVAGFDEIMTIFSRRGYERMQEIRKTLTPYVVPFKEKTIKPKYGPEIPTQTLVAKGI